MLLVYVNYANPHARAHADPNCGFVQGVPAAGQRMIRIDGTTLAAELKRFREEEYAFSTQPGFRDMWLSVDFGDIDFEHVVASHLLGLLGNRHDPLKRAELIDHC